MLKIAETVTKIAKYLPDRILNFLQQSLPRRLQSVTKVLSSQSDLYSECPVSKLEPQLLLH